MRVSVVSLYVALAAAGFTGPAIAQNAPPAVSTSAALSPAASQAAAVVDAFHRSLHRGDGAAAAVLLANDALIYESGGVEQNKAEYASHHLSADAAFSKATNRTVTQRSGQADNNVAWIATVSTTKGSYKGRLINSVSTETMVLRRDGTAWRIVHVHWSSANLK